MQFQQLPLKSLVKGKNPRSYFDESALNELAQSIEHNGVITPILVRPVKGGSGDLYEIIAGERRYRASMKVYGEDGLIPASIVDFDNEEAGRASLIENMQREAMSATEESDACAKVLYAVSGDREEAAKVLGMSKSKFDARLLLQNLVPEVKESLNARTLMLGHAELLSAAPKEKQAGALKVILENKLTVAQTRDLMLKATQKLASAIFDLAQCNGCPSNSETQATLLETNLGSGFCVNKSCFEQKTEQELEKRELALKEAYPMVVRSSGTDGKVIIPLRVEMVGQAQVDACKGCSNYGAVLYTDVNRLGSIDEQTCFDAVCNAKKVAANLAEKKKQEQAAVEPSNQAEELGESEVSTQEKSQKAQPKKPKEVPSVASLNARAKEYKERTWRQIVAKEIFSDRKIAREVLICALFNGHGRNISSSELGKRSKAILGFETNGVGINANDLSGVAQSDDDVRQRALDACAAVLAFGMDMFSHVEMIAKKYEFSLEKHWRMDKEFIEIFTKSEIESILIETGIREIMGEEVFKKAIGSKKDELIKTILGTEGVDWMAAIPSMMQVSK